VLVSNALPMHVPSYPPIPSLSQVLEKELPQLIKSGLRSIKMFMTYPKNRVDDAEILRVFECARANGALVCIHAENDSAISHMTNALVAAGKVGTKYHAVAK
jgi:dihydropyrimidinase